ncbi:major lipid droplet protein [Dunaliella salina]|uniref:Major lipid droplet protein n=1 Tax=Dunaliella salina TaxID=3046 RepID=G9L6P5_DUNSA|nr:major lipid droplet protein [Dunaliella salina]KAF5841012.1 major lipid droplet protein [Dunaliella salina]|eukprot:KAF5841012.1 major lipid droplet protein [Dunaliella salina]
MAPKAVEKQQTPSPGPQLRRLGWVRSVVSTVASTAAPILGQVQHAGDLILERLGRKEQLATYTAPLVLRATDIGDAALNTLDQQVDYVINTGSSAVGTAQQTIHDSANGVREIHSANLAFLNNAFQTYLTSLQQATDWAVENLNPVRASRAAWDWARATLARMQELLDPDTLYNFLRERWAAFTSIPVVRGVLDTVQPITNAFWSIFYALHDFVVSSGLYKFAVDSSLSTWHWITDSSPYKLGAQYLYPIVQPVADPTLDKFAHSQVVNSTLDYWKPNTVVA